MRRKSSGRKRSGILGLGLCAASLLLLMVPLTAAADQPGESGGIGQAGNAISLLQPIKNDLSSTAWLIASGMDPRTWVTSPGANPPALGGSGPLAPGSGQSAGNSGSGAPLVPFRNPAPSFSRNLLISREFGLFPVQTEPSLAVDPTNPLHLIMATIDYNFPALSTYTSYDGGETWDGPHQVRYFSEDLSTAGDPVVMFGRDGTAYVAQISLGVQDFTIGTLVSEQEVSSIVIAKSTDGGLTWSDPVSAARATIVTHPTTDSQGRQTGTVDAGFLDKPWMAVGPSKTNPSKDEVYVTFTNFVTEFSILYADQVPFLTAPATQATIQEVYSGDGGLTWSKPVNVSPTVLQVAGASKPGNDAGGSGDSATASTSLASLLGFTPDQTARQEGEAWVAAHPDSLAAQTGPAAGQMMAWSAPIVGQPLSMQSSQTAVTPSATDQSGNSSGSVSEQQPTQAQFNQTANRTVQGSQPKVLSDGTVVVAYLDTTNDGVQQGLDAIMVARSTDGGKTFGEPIQAGVLLETHFSPRNSFFRYWGGDFPQIAIGPKDQVYILTMALPPNKPTDDGEIYFLRSLDGGKTWDAPKPLDPDKTNRTQFFPSITVDPNGDLHAMWGDFRDDPNEVRYNIYYTRSNDQGTTWGFTSSEQHITFPDTRVSDFASNSLKGFPDGAFLGDYFSIAASKDDVFMVWADTRLGEFNGPAQNIAFAREQAIQSPGIFISPASGPAGQVVTIQGFNYEPDSNIAITVAGSTVANERTDDQGKFTTELFMPITSEGAQTVQAFDDSGNVASASYYTSFGFDTIQQVLGQLGTKAPSAAPAASGTPSAATPSASPAAPPALGTPPPLGNPEASAPVSVTSLGGMALFGGLGGIVLASFGSIEWLRRKRR